MVLPDKTRLAEREYVSKVLADNKRFWEDQLVWWEAEFGAEYVAKLKERLNGKGG